MLRDHDWHSVTLFAKKTSSGYLFEQSATSGWAREFFQKSPDVTGTYIVRAYEQCFKEGRFVKMTRLSFEQCAVCAVQKELVIREVFSFYI